MNSLDPHFLCHPHHLCLFVCSNWLQSSKISGNHHLRTQVMEREPAPCDDIRQKGYPCFGAHKPGKMRTNQYASWMACARCALRLTYVSKGNSHGQDRQSCPEPHLLRATMEELEKSVRADSCTEAIVQGKLMELKGKMVQAGLTNTRTIHLTYAEYLDRLKRAGYVPSLGQTSQASLPMMPLTTAPPATPPEMLGNQLDAPMSNLAAENEELRERLRVAENTTAEAMRRTEMLAEESARQKEVAATQHAEMENLRKMAQKKEVQGKPNESLGASPSKDSHHSGEAVKVPSDSEEENSEKKRTRAEAASK